MSTNPRPLVVPRAEAQNSKWARRRDVPIAILAWIAVVAVIFWAAGHIVRSLLLLAIAALLAYALAPAVKLLQRVMPRFLAILIVYLVVLSSISLLLYTIVSTAVHQTIQLSHYIQFLLTPSSNGQPTPLEQTLQSLGISQAQIISLREQIIARTENVAGGILPLLTSIFDIILDVVVVAVLSIYLLIDGSRAVSWLRSNLPRTARADFLLDTLQRVIGGYIRGQLFLAVLIGVLVGGGMLIFHVPYAVLLGVLAFILEFIPVLGTLLSGAICTLIALTQGWLIAVGVLIYFIVMHVIEGDIVGPRIVGKAVGLHPVVSLAALIAGSELFGIWGALFASPIAGVLQAILVTVWLEWRAAYPEQFEEVKEQVADKIEQNSQQKP